MKKYQINNIFIKQVFFLSFFLFGLFLSLNFLSVQKTKAAGFSDQELSSACFKDCSVVSQIDQPSCDNKCFNLPLPPGLSLAPEAADANLGTFDNCMQFCDNRPGTQQGHLDQCGAMCPNAFVLTDAQTKYNECMASPNNAKIAQQKKQSLRDYCAIQVGMKTCTGQSETGLLNCLGSAPPNLPKTDAIGFNNLPQLTGFFDISSCTIKTPEGKKPDINNPTEGYSIICVIQNVISMMMIAVGAIVVVMIIISGVGYMVSMGNPTQTAWAKKSLAGAFIGLIIVVLAYSIVKIVAIFFGG